MRVERALTGCLLGLWLVNGTRSRGGVYRLGRAVSGFRCGGACLKAVFCGGKGDCDGLVKGVLKVVFGLISPFSIIRIDDGFQFLFLIETQIIIKKIIDLEYYCLTI